MKTQERIDELTQCPAWETHVSSLEALALQLDSKLAEKTNEASKAQKFKQAFIETEQEIALLREENKEIRKLLKRCVKLTDKILMEMPRPYPVMWFVELSEEIGGIYEQLAELATVPEEPVSDWKCPHCGSTKGTWFSRVEPMGDICEDCGKSVDEEPVIQENRITEPFSTPTDLKQQNKENTPSLNEWRELGEDEVPQVGDEWYSDIGKRWVTSIGSSGEKVSRFDGIRFRTRRPLPVQEDKAPDDLHAWMRLQEDINREVAGEIRYLRDEIQKLKQTNE